MPLYVAFFMIPILIAGGILLLRFGKKTGRKILTVAGIVLFAFLLMFLLYMGAAFLLLSAID